MAMLHSFREGSTSNKNHRIQGFIDRNRLKILLFFCAKQVVSLTHDSANAINFWGLHIISRKNAV